MQLFKACFLYWICCVSAREIIISENGGNVPSCLEEHNVVVSCQSLVDVSQHVSHKLNNVTIRINDTNYTLQGVANFSGVEGIAIIGKDHSLTLINCNSSKTSQAGIAFYRSSNITLTNFTISNCGATIAKRHYHEQGTAIQIIDCYGVNILGIVVYRSISQGLAFINTVSTVRVIDSYFINNTVSQNRWSGGGGLQILFHGTENIANYVIANSVFKYNNAIPNIITELKIYDSKNCERGGGIRIILYGGVCKITVSLDNNMLIGNFAVFGGGALVYVVGNASRNEINLLNNHFINNTVLAGGGGIDTGYTTLKFSYPTNNTINITNSSFIGNQASFGGGLSMFTASISYSENHANNYFKCKYCEFKRNTACGGAAVNMGRGIFKNDGSQNIMIPWFVDSVIMDNTVICDSSSVTDGNTGASYGNGAFFVSELDVTFAKSTIFSGNNGTALYLDSTTAVFDKGTVYFINNSGYQGGAILLFGKSDIYVRKDISFFFLNNTATKMGGAICGLTGGKHVFSYMNSCFLKVSRTRTMLSKNLTFYFSGNTATIGNDIYATSIASCNFLCSRQLKYTINNTSPFFHYNCYGNFSLGNSNITKSVATSPVKIKVIKFKHIVMPGIAAPLKLIQSDEIGGDVGKLFPLTARIKGSLYGVMADYVVSNNLITFLGIPGDKGNLHLESSSIRQVIQFELSHCGPGLLFNHTAKKCICSEDYPDIRCEPHKFAALPSNYWAGYINCNSTDATQNNFSSGICLTELCKPQSCNDNGLLCKLPLSADAKTLEKKICGENRHGRLCGRCVENTSVYYHSDTYVCGNNSGCQFGILIYIASELLPVTIIFLDYFALQHQSHFRSCL